MEQQMGRIVLLTGVTGGLGTAVVRAFAAEGSRLILSARRTDELEVVAQATALAEDRVLLAAADVTDAAAVQQLIERGVERFGTPDVVAHLVGGYAGGSAVAESDEATWQRMLGLNLMPAVLLARAVLPGMLARGSGKLVYVSSRAGSVPGANQAAYAVSKGALEVFVRNLAEEVRSRNINVNAVAPSVIDTPANRRANPTADYATWVQPSSLAAAIAYLASDAARNIHGAIVPVVGPE